MQTHLCKLGLEGVRGCNCEDLLQELPALGGRKCRAVPSSPRTLHLCQLTHSLLVWVGCKPAPERLQQPHRRPSGQVTEGGDLGTNLAEEHLRSNLHNHRRVRLHVHRLNVSATGLRRCGASSSLCRGHSSGSLLYRPTGSAAQLALESEVSFRRHALPLHLDTERRMARACGPKERILAPEEQVAAPHAGQLRLQVGLGMCLRAHVDHTPQDKVIACSPDHFVLLGPNDKGKGVRQRVHMVVAAPAEAAVVGLLGPLGDVHAVDALDIVEASLPVLRPLVPLDALVRTIEELLQLAFDLHVDLLTIRLGVLLELLQDLPGIELRSLLRLEAVDLESS
mmetsp:Transcript_65668/g.140412  ORF Transcript_65668/g.140412 Transcript_65668/m.140412 type:complete len:338 (-) Transcript_65668:661-1674(-)